MAGTVKAAILTGNIVEEYKIGNSTIKICDSAYINKTPEDIEKILKRLTSIGWECVHSARAAGKDI
jgi:hypothetical protein